MSEPREELIHGEQYCEHCNDFVLMCSHGCGICWKTLCEQAEKERDEAIRALKKCHRKHNQGDDSIGWGELEELIHNTLANLMGDKDYVKWVNKEKGG